MAFLWNVLPIVMLFMVTDGSFKLLATENACYSATAYSTDYNFNAPAAGNVFGVELEYVSGAVRCSVNFDYTNFGCAGWVMMNLLMLNDDGSDAMIYPTDFMRGVEKMEVSTCSNGHDCGTRILMTNYDDTSPAIEWLDEANPIAVTKDDTFSLQYTEGCCEYSTSDNSGTACARVYFIYSTVHPTADPTADPSAEPTADPTVEPTADPTVEPTADPTRDPNPTNYPTADPTDDHTLQTLKLFTEDAAVTDTGSKGLSSWMWVKWLVLGIVATVLVLVAVCIVCLCRRECRPTVSPATNENDADCIATSATHAVVDMATSASSTDYAGSAVEDAEGQIAGAKTL